MIDNALPDDPTPTAAEERRRWTPGTARLGARMVAFAGYAMPVQYQGVLAEHLHCRAQAALFDVSHMGQATLTGAAAAAALERLVPGDMLGPEAGPAALHAADQRGRRHPRRPDGGQPRRRPAVPGGQRQPQGRSTSPISPPTCPPACSFSPHEDRALLALQGPAAAAVMRRLGAGGRASCRSWASRQ